MGERLGLIQRLSQVRRNIPGASDPSSPWADDWAVVREAEEELIRLRDANAEAERLLAICRDNPRDEDAERIGELEAENARLGSGVQRDEAQVLAVLRDVFDYAAPSDWKKAARALATPAPAPSGEQANLSELRETLQYLCDNNGEYGLDLNDEWDFVRNWLAAAQPATGEGQSHHGQDKCVPVDGGCAPTTGEGGRG